MKKKLTVDSIGAKYTVANSLHIIEPAAAIISEKNLVAQNHISERY